jgi:hypothetical protein
MASPVTAYYAGILADWLHGSQMPTPPTSLYVAFYTGTSTEVSASGTAYARQAIATPAGWTKSTVGSAVRIANTSTLTCPTATGAGWGLVAYAGLFDALAGHLLAQKALDVAKQIDVGENLVFPAGALYFEWQFT